MPSKEVQEVLEQLHFELLRAGPLDEETQLKVDGLTEHLRNVMDEPESEEHQQALKAMLDDQITELEVSHPTVTSLLGELAHLLSSIGI